MDTFDMFMLVVLVMLSFLLGAWFQESEYKQYSECKEYFSHSENWALPFPEHIDKCLK